MNRRSTILLLLATVLLVFSILLGGCLTTIGDSSETSGGEGKFFAVEAPETPPNATVVDYFDDRVQANEYLQEAIRKAAADDSGTVVVTVSEDEVEQTKTDIQGLPLYTLEQADSDQYEWGYYFEYQGAVVRVEFAILD